MFVVVGVTGGIAAYKTVHLVRALVTNGHEVHVVPTEDSLRFVGTTTWEAVSRNPVTTSVHDDVARVRHVALGTSADLVVIAPATANTLAKMAAGIADDLLGVTLLATTAPVVVAPAMHTRCGSTRPRRPTSPPPRARRARGGPGRRSAHRRRQRAGAHGGAEEIVAAALAVAAARPADLAGLRVAVSTGGTREPIDPCASSATAPAAGRGRARPRRRRPRRRGRARGGARRRRVLDAASRHAHHVVRVGTAAELQAAMTDAAAAADVVAMVAAVADYRVGRSRTKSCARRTACRGWTSCHPDILAGSSRRAGRADVIGFAAETAATTPSCSGAGAASGSARASTCSRQPRRLGPRLRGDRQPRAPAGCRRPVVADAAGSKRVVADAIWDAVAATR
jgi:phosphopantothenoylcysteine decarboxylase/phosphopantothenate--cysteine ligase